MLIYAAVQLSPCPIAHSIAAHVLPIPIYETQIFFLYNENWENGAEPTVIVLHARECVIVCMALSAYYVLSLQESCRNTGQQCSSLSCAWADDAV